MRSNDAASSTNLTEINRSTHESGGVQVWVNSFEKLLEDAAGLHTFAVFLQKEFSAENIYFWTACERYRKIEDHADRTKEANAIFSKHLAVGASDPVNVDSKARTLTQEKLNFAEKDLFAQVSSSLLQSIHSVSNSGFFTGSKANFQPNEIRQLPTIYQI